MFTSACVNFTNALRADFMHKDLKSDKIQSSCLYLFALLGSARVEAAQKMLMNLSSCMCMCCKTKEDEETVGLALRGNSIEKLES